LPPDVSELLARLHKPAPEPPVQLIICLSGGPRRVLLAGPVPIHVSPLRDRAEELPRIVEEYADEAIAALSAPAKSFTHADLWWVVEHAAKSLAEIEKATLRVVALKVSANDVTQAAELLGMAPISLARWLTRRSYPSPSLAGALRSHGW
jgi:DNA-binding NtrC family response regulator